MRNENNCQPLVDELTDRLEHSFGLSRSKHRRWLVENQHVDVTVQCFENFNALLFADIEFPDFGVRVNLQPVLVSKLGETTARTISVSAEHFREIVSDPRARRSGFTFAQHNVF